MVKHCYAHPYYRCVLKPTMHREEGLCLATVQVRENESLDSALKRFKKALQQTGILKEAREHEHYEKPSDKKRKAEAARRRKMKSASR